MESMQQPTAQHEGWMAQFKEVTKDVPHMFNHQNFLVFAMTKAWLIGTEDGRRELARLATWAGCVLFLLCAGCAANFSGLPAPMTPVGTGLPRLDKPWAPHAEPLPPSTNHRILPATQEPGLWAADQPRASVAPGARVAGIELPIPDVEPERAASEANICATMMGSIIRLEGHTGAITSMPLATRRCLAARLYGLCADWWLKNAEDFSGHGHHDQGAVTSANAMKDTASAFERTACGDAWTKRDTNILFEAMKPKWWELANAGKRR